MEQLRILISGAGIAGTALAHHLHRLGAQVTVVERAEALRAGGYKVDIRGAALTVAERMGVLDTVRSLRTGVRAGTVVDRTGRRVASLDGDTFGGRVHEDAELMRGDLNRVLFDLTKGVVDYRFGDTITALAQDPDGVDVTFASGRTGRFDLVVGADGVHSTTRRLAFGDTPGAVQDLGYGVSLWSVPNFLGLDREEVTFTGPGCTALMYSTAGQADAKALFLFRTPDAPLPRDRAAQQALLRELYAGQGWEVPRLLDSLDETQDFYFDSISQVKLDRWSAGRVVLLGDAAACASPASGQGTSLALVGAHVLAGELARATSLAGGLAAYERLMRPFVAANQKLAPAFIKRMVLPSAGAVRTAMVMLKVLNRLPGKDKLMARMIEPVHRAATAIELPAYPLGAPAPRPAA